MKAATTNLTDIFIFNPLIRSEFNEFLQKSGYQLDINIFANLLVLFAFLFSTYMFFFHSLLTKYDYLFTAAFVVASMSIIVKIIVVFLRCKASQFHYIETLNVIGIFFMIFACEMVMIGRVLNGPCDNFRAVNEFNKWKCNNTEVLPPHQTIILMLAPIFMFIISHSNAAISIFVFISVIVTLIISICIGNYKSSIVIITLYFFTFLLMLSEVRRQHLLYFFAAKHLKWSLQENERMADDSLATELRHMIGNVAHDLKTVLLLLF
jgi:hypothetical protein